MGCIDLEDGHAPAGTEHPCRFGQGAGQIREITQGVPADEPVERAVGEGELAAVRLQQGRPVRWP